jgi:fructose-bisphosphate aldolase, class I
MRLLKKRNNLRKISRKCKFMFLAYDQGLEHGPTDFDDDNVDPNNIIEIAEKGDYTGIIFQKGIAEKYFSEIKKSRVPLIVKLNGKTNLVEGDPISPQLCTVQEAIDLGASAVGFTVYIGSEHEEEMMEEFVAMQREAHKNNLPVIAWIYPRGKSLKGKKEGDLLAYAARVGLEIGADIIKIHSHGNKKDLAWAVEAAAKARVVIAGGSKKKEAALKKEIEEAMSVGVSGIAIGRNIWQAKDPLRLSEELKRVIWGK